MPNHLINDFFAFSKLTLTPVFGYLTPRENISLIAYIGSIASILLMAPMSKTYIALVGT